MEPSRGTFGAYLQKHMDTKGWNPTDLSRAAREAADPAGPKGPDATAIARWIRGEIKPSVENLRLVAIAISRPIAEVLVAAEILRAEEVELQVVAEPERLSDEQLLAEVGRRMKVPSVMRPPTREEIAANPDRFVVVDPKKKDHREPSGRRQPS